jgi:hypothetical protein
VATLRIRQYVYFAIKSRNLSAEEVERRLGVRPDRVLVSGAERKYPPRPAAHSWELVSTEPGLTVDEQISMLLTRLQPARAAIRDLTATEDVVAVLQVVRYLDDDEGELELSTIVRGMKKLPGQHHLLGWHLDLEVMRFLCEVGADLDIDEYG